MVNLTRFLIVFVIAFLIFNSDLHSSSLTRVDPEHETHYKIIVGYYFDKINIGFNLHIFVNKDVYIDQTFSILPQYMMDNEWLNSFYYDTQIQLGHFGYKKIWLYNENTMYTNQVFIETLE